MLPDESRQVVEVLPTTTGRPRPARQRRALMTNLLWSAQPDAGAGGRSA
ncbi:MAG: hypothetical protein ACLFRD_07990 [Nitriliruptoraceae bacterium]